MFSALAAAALLAGCGGGTPEVTGDPASTSEIAATSEAPTSPTTPTPRPTPSATTSPTSPSPTSPPPTSAVSPEPTAEPTDPGTTSPAAPALPAQAAAEHGGTDVAVYLAITDQGFDSPPVQQAQAVARELGYEVGAGDLGCDRGAAEALGYDSGSGQTWAAVALYFDTVEEAETVQAAAEDAGHPVVGVAEVTTYCLD